MKTLTIECSHGLVVGLPVSVVAEDRAKYYAEKDPSTTYKEEYEFTMDNECEIVDWFQNNMDYMKIQDKLFVVEPKRNLTLLEEVQDAVTSGTDFSVLEYSKK